MILRSLVPPFGKGPSLLADIETAVTQVVTAPDNCASDTTCSAVWMRNLDVAVYLHADPLLRFNQINDPETPLQVTIDDLAFSVVQSWRAYGVFHV